MQKRSMWLRLDSDGIIINFNIGNYKYTKQENGDHSWCDTEMNVESRIINYSLSNEILLCAEIDELSDVLRRLLAGEYREETTLYFIEPDLEFVF